MATLNTVTKKCSHYDKDTFHTVCGNGNGPHTPSANTNNAGDDADKSAPGSHASPWDWITLFGTEYVFNKMVFCLQVQG